MSRSFTFCPHCGSPLSDGFAAGRRRPRCLHCGFIHFQDPKVAVAGLVTLWDRLVLVRRAVPPQKGLWGLPAGYMDADELPEEALRRELSEETGLSVGELVLCGVAPLAGWEERRGILLIYRGEPVSGELAPGDDVSEARWFRRQEIPWSELAFESTVQYVRAWLDASSGDPGASASSGKA